MKNKFYYKFLHLKPVPASPQSMFAGAAACGDDDVVVVVLLVGLQGANRGVGSGLVGGGGGDGDGGRSQTYK